MEFVKAIGAWFALTVVHSSIDTVISSAIEQYRLRPGLNDAQVSLKTSLSKANAIIVAIGRNTVAEEHLTMLLEQLKEAAHDANDLLCELEYQELKKRVEDERVVHHPTSWRKRKRYQLSGFLPGAFKFASDFLNDATTKVREVQKRVDEITTAIEQVVSVVGSNQKDESHRRVTEESSSSLLPDSYYAFGRAEDYERLTAIEQVVSVVGSNQKDEISHGRVTEGSSSSSLLPDSYVIGRAGDYERLTELLLKPDEGSQTETNKVISLVGMGGIGKTTLARWAFTELEEKFEEKIWICASDSFDVNKITREILRTVDKEYPILTELDKLQVTMKEKLESKRFLLVIDDAWNEDGRKWENFYAPLRCGAPGSKILVTTRSHNVAAIVNSKYTMLLEGIQEDTYCSFFNRCAFGDEDPSKYGNMELIGRKIASRLKGSPLAAKAIGNLLKSHFSEDYWNTILLNGIQITGHLRVREGRLLPPLNRLI